MKQKHTIIDYTLMAITGLYLLNITFGMIELIPDNIPVIGNIDEVIATLIFLKSYNYKH